jgi:hypothetical protein
MIWPGARSKIRAVAALGRSSVSSNFADALAIPGHGANHALAKPGFEAGIDHDKVSVGERKQLSHSSCFDRAAKRQGITRRARAGEREHKK